MVIFAGACTRCEESHTWDDLTQYLSCLEAKNNCSFGDCDAAVYEERHDFDQECDRCAEEDEGVGDVGDDEDGAIEVADAKRSTADDGDRDAKKQRTDS